MAEIAPSPDVALPRPTLAPACRFPAVERMLEYQRVCNT